MRTRTGLLFSVAAAWNWSIAVVGSFFPAVFYQLAMPIAVPENRAMIWFFMTLVAAFGLGYFWASRDFEANRSIVKLGVVGKLAVFGLAVLLLIYGDIRILFFLIAVGDLVFAIAFLDALGKLTRANGKSA